MDAADAPLSREHRAENAADIIVRAFMFRGKRELLAHGLYWSGIHFLLGSLPARDTLLVLNYHRVGAPQDDLFDPGVFSATADELNEQITYLKRHVSLITLEEALSFCDGTLRDRTPRCRVLITFDDGYLDNYKLAFPILRSHGAQGVFFLATGLVGSCSVPWWDRIAFLLKTATRRRFSLDYPAALAVDLEANGLTRSLQDVLGLYATPGNRDPEGFVSELRHQSGGADLPTTLRRFLDWDEAREMLAGGMAIGSHTHSHELLSQFGTERQRQELAHSRSLLKEKLNLDARAIAYPVGGITAFSEETKTLARETGYRIAFSFYGGANAPGRTAPYDVKRVGVGNASQIRFRVQAAACRATREYWP